jgi:FkbM family methyltransferase
MIRNLLPKLYEKTLHLRNSKYRDYPKHRHPKGEFISDNIRKSKVYYELQLLHYLRKNTDFSVALDIGANIGNHSKFFSEFGGLVYSIEPIKKNFVLLQKNAPEAIAFNVAVGDKAGVTEFVTYESCLGNSYSIDAFNGQINDWGTGINMEKVEVVTIDSLTLKTPTLVKLDVEGFELRALKGAGELLTKSKNTKICIELHSEKDLTNSGFEYSQRDIKDQLKYFGFNHYKMINATNYLFSKV